MKILCPALQEAQGYAPELLRACGPDEDRSVSRSRLSPQNYYGPAVLLKIVVCLAQGYPPTFTALRS